MWFACVVPSFDRKFRLFSLLFKYLRVKFKLSRVGLLATTMWFCVFHWWIYWIAVRRPCTLGGDAHSVDHPSVYAVILAAYGGFSCLLCCFCRLVITSY